MAFIIRNKTASNIDIIDIGTRLKASADRDITILGLGEIYDSEDLATYILAGDIAVLDPADGITELSPGDSLAASTGSALSPVNGDLASVSVTNSTQALTASFVGIHFGSSLVENDTDVLEHDNTNTDRIQIKETGLYAIAYSLEFIGGDNDEIITAKVVVDDTTDIAGTTRTAEIIHNGVRDLSSNVTAELTAGTYINLECNVTDVATASSIVAESTFTVTRGKGSKGSAGAAGPTGAGSSVLVYEEGTVVPNGPHSELNFIGDGVTATDAGSGRTDITIESGGGGAVDRQAALTSASYASNSSTLQDLTGMSLTTSDLGEAGDYLITFSAEMKAADDGKENIIALLVDGVNVANYKDQPVKKNKYQTFHLTHLAESVPAGTVIKVQVAQDDDETLTVLTRELTINGVGESNVI